MIRNCDGTDPNLTRDIPADQFDAATMTVSPWDMAAKPGEVVINCQCHQVFDDDDHLTFYPHEVF